MSGNMPPACAHLDLVRRAVGPRTPDGCEECLRTGGWWVHLRLCLTCGHVGCCDQSPGRHATRHFQDWEHPMMRSIEPGEDWGSGANLPIPDPQALVEGATT